MNVTIIGTGYVGLVTGACLAAIDHHVVCVDVDAERIKIINQGNAPFYEPGLQELIAKSLRNGCLRATTDLYQSVKESDVSIIAVGTPTNDAGVDLSFVRSAVTSLGKALRDINDFHTVTVKSTVPPGTTDTIVRQILEQESGRRVGEFGLCMNPEFLREGSAVDDFMMADRIVIGRYDERSAHKLLELFDRFECPKICTTLRNAELIKYTSNALLSVLVSFSNEIASLCEATEDTDIDEIMNALHLDKRLSPIVNGERVTPGILSYLRAGVGYGGSCLPKDIHGLRLFAKQHHLNTFLLDAAVKVNELRSKQIVTMLEQTCGSRLRGLTVAVLGLAFKPGTDDMRDSPALAIVRCLLDNEAHVRAYDPLAAERARILFGDQVLICTDPTQLLEGAHAALLVTAWPEFASWNWKSLCELMSTPIIIDGRNSLKNINWPPGTVYRMIGRHYE